MIDEIFDVETVAEGLKILPVGITYNARVMNISVPNSVNNTADEKWHSK